MPQRINVIRLSDEERDVLRNATSQGDVKAIAKAVTDTLRAGADRTRAAASAVEMDPEKFRALRSDLTARLSALSALPVPDEVKAPLTQSTQAALDIVEDALRMLDQ